MKIVSGSALFSEQQIQLTALLGLDKLIAELGGNAELILNRYALKVDDLHRKDKRISVHKLISLLNSVAGELHCPDFGLRLGAYQDFRVLGDAGMLIQSSPNLYSALHAARSINRYHNQAEYWRPFHFQHCLVFRRYELYQQQVDTRHYKEMAMSACYQMGLRLLGKQFDNVTVEFSHAEALPISAYQGYFSGPVQFNCEYDQLTIPAALADAPLTTSNEQQRIAAKHTLDQSQQKLEADLIQQVIVVLQQLLSSGNLSIESVANTLAMSKRSLQRRLAERGINFRHLVELQRIEVASRYLSSSRTDITLIAEIVGYTDPGNFCRAFKRVKGVSPRQWRTICQAPSNSEC